MRLPKLPDNEWGNNKRKIINIFFMNKTATMPELAREVKVSIPTVTKIVMELINEGLVSEGYKIESKAGRRPITYHMNPTAGYFLGIEIKNGHAGIGISNLAGDMVAERLDLRYDPTQEDFKTVREIGAKALELIKESGIGKDEIFRACVSVSGRVNPASGASYTTFSFAGTTLADMLAESIGIPSVVENDTRAMTYAEYLSCGKPNVKDALYVNLGWGLGLGIVIDGNLYGGKSGFAGEWGHTYAFDNEILCHCGKRGCLETEVSGQALQRELVAQIKEGRASMLSGKVERGEELTIKDMMEAASAGDMLVIEILEKIGEKLGKNLASMINVFNPELVIVGGPLAKANYYLLPPVRQAVNKYSLPLVHRDTEIIGSDLAGRAGVIGACLTARRGMME